MIGFTRIWNTTVNAPPPSPDPWPAAVLLRLDEMCQRFEAAWKSGPPPVVETYLQECPETERSALLQQLLPLDLEYRARQGLTPLPDDYLSRFPEFGDVIRSVFDANTTA